MTIETGLSGFLSPAPCDEPEQAQTRQQHAIGVRFRNRSYCKRRVAAAAIERKAEVASAQRNRGDHGARIGEGGGQVQRCESVGIDKEGCERGIRYEGGENLRSRQETACPEGE